MSEGVLPPVPDLIPIAALERRSMGEQRPRRRAPAELIDTAAGSRAASAAPPSLPRSRAARPGQRRRKSDRRRELRRADSVRSVGKQGSRNRSNSPALDKPPRVNPIFVWVRQEDTRIVDVKCEDYDKRNRILLTKTAQGWKAIPRTETTASTNKLSENQEETNSHHHHHHHKHHRKHLHKHKSRRKSVSLQFPENSDNTTPSNPSSSSWLHPENINIESLLPSHTIQIKRTHSVDESYSDNVNRDVDDLGHALPKCIAPDKVCDVSPLENLLAVAELEFKQQMESGVWKNESENTTIQNIENNENTLLENVDKPNSENSTPENDRTNQHDDQTKLIDDMKIVECDDYNEDDDGMAMTDILSRLEKSLQSPENEEQHAGECKEIDNKENDSDNVTDDQDICDLEAVHDDTNQQDRHEDKEVENEEIVCVNSSEKCEPQETSGDTSELQKPEVYLTTKSFCKEVPEKFTDIPMELEEISTALPITLESSTRTSEIAETEDHLKTSTPVLVESLTAPVIPSDETKECLENKLLSESNFIETTVPVEALHSSSTDKPEENQENNAILDSTSTAFDDTLPKGSKDNSDTDENRNQTKLNNEEEDCIPAPTTQTNILEILSKEVEKIEPIKPKMNEPKYEAEPQPLDFSIKSKTTILTINTDVDDSLEEPTDLTVRKSDNNSQEREKRPLSQSSEAIQSPQPSGIPAVLHSPEIVSTSTTPKNKSAFLDSLLANVTNRATFNSDLTISKHSEPKEIENRRKSASPTVTCSEEIVNKPVPEIIEPPTKKFKPDDITLKHFLDKEQESLKNKSTAQEPRSTSTPALLELLKDTPEKTDPLTDFKKLLLEVDIPEPLMVPKTRFVNLLKNPREEIFNLMRDKSYKNLRIDDILVVYKEKLFAALEANAKLEKTISESKPNQVVERRSSHSDKALSNPNKRKAPDSLPKNISPESTVKNISASDIDAATEAAFSQMMMFPYQSQLDAMSWASSQQELLQALYGSNPFLPGQPSEMNSNLQMMFGNNRIPPLSPLGFSAIPPMNFTNPLEFSMWQEAMMQASLLRNKTAFDNSILNQPVRDFKSQIPPRRYSSHGSQPHSCSSKNQGNPSKSASQQMQEQQHLLQKLYEQNSLSSQMCHNPYLGQAGYQHKNHSPLTVPQYNPYQHSRNHSSRIPYQEKETNHMESYREHEKKLQQQIMLERQKALQKQQQDRMQREHRLQERLQQKPMTKPSSLSNKSIPSNPFAIPKLPSHQECLLNEVTPRQVGYQPMDLSGSQILPVRSKSGVDHKTEKSQASSTTSRTHDEVAEVGSTTASIEEMQDANTHLWHPFFGSDKGYTPWNMTSVTDSE